MLPAARELEPRTGSVLDHLVIWSGRRPEPDRARRQREPGRARRPPETG